MSSIGISIILPTLNEEENLSKIIPEIISKFKKNNLDYEIVVVDDNSSDNTDLTMNKFISENPNIKFVKEKTHPFHFQFMKELKIQEWSMLCG